MSQSPEKGEQIHIAVPTENQSPQVAEPTEVHVTKDHGSLLSFLSAASFVLGPALIACDLAFIIAFAVIIGKRGDDYGCSNKTWLMGQIIMYTEVASFFLRIFDFVTNYIPSIPIRREFKLIANCWSSLFNLYKFSVWLVAQCYLYRSNNDCKDLWRSMYDCTLAWIIVQYIIMLGIAVVFALSCFGIGRLEMIEGPAWDGTKMDRVRNFIKNTIWGISGH